MIRILVLVVETKLVKMIRLTTLSAEIQTIIHKKKMNMMTETDLIRIVDLLRLVERDHCMIKTTALFTPTIDHSIPVKNQNHTIPKKDQDQKHTRNQN